MCLMCEEQDLYFLYLERVEQARRIARGEIVEPNPGWLWPTAARSEAPAAPEPVAKPGFVCDAPE
jgi:hypothetical protein